MAKEIPLDRMRGLVLRAMEAGASRPSQFTTEWRCEGDCLDPHCTERVSHPEARETFREALHRSVTERREVDGFDLAGSPLVRRHARKFVTVGGPQPQPLRLLLWTRCRECAACRRARRNLWATRATAEYALAQRTWFGTLTLRPEEQFRAKLLAENKCGGQSVYDGLTEAEQFSFRASVVGQWLTLYIKRVRSAVAVAPGSPFRYLAVFEAHQSGAPHIHVLLHERSCAVRQKTLIAKWPHGFVKWKLVEDERQATYVTKYLAKDARTRLRASFHYGDLSTPTGIGASDKASLRVGQLTRPSDPTPLSDPGASAVAVEGP